MKNYIMASHLYLENYFKKNVQARAIKYERCNMKFFVSTWKSNYSRKFQTVLNQQHRIGLNICLPKKKLIEKLSKKTC